jgi:hypothetical protein
VSRTLALHKHATKLLASCEARSLADLVRKIHFLLPVLVFAKAIPGSSKISPKFSVAYSFVIPYLLEVKDRCSQKNWNLALSNPCFEVWLYCHLETLAHEASPLSSCQDYKHALHQHWKGGYKPETFTQVEWIERAIKKAESGFQSNDGFLPNGNCTKVYMLMKELKTFFTHQ